MNYQNISEEKFELLKKVNTKIGLDKTLNVIFVYCPPKLGSTSLVSSLRLSASHIFKVIHVHDEQMLKILTGIEGVTIQEIIDFNAFLDKNVYVIDLYREPIERKMSEFFGKIATYHFNVTNEKIETYSLPRIIKRFNQIFTHIGEGDYYLEKYRDVIMYPPPHFDFVTSCLTHKQGKNLIYIKLRLRDSNKWGEILSTILRTEITIIRDYERKNLPLADLYQKFKDNYILPINFVDYLKNDRCLSFYLTPTERQEYIQRWANKSGPAVQYLSTNEYKIYSVITDENQSCIDIESEHYFDDGCICKGCSKMRKLVLTQIKNGVKPTTRLSHYLITNNPEQTQQQIIQQTQQQMIQQNPQPQIIQQNPQPKYNVPQQQKQRSNNPTIVMRLRTSRFRR